MTAANNYFGYGGLGVDLLHPGTLVVASVNSWWPDAQIYRTTNGGTTWTPIWTWASYPSRTLNYTMDITNAPWLNFGDTNPVDPVPAVKLGWMIEGMNIDPFNSDRLFYGTGATLYETTNLTAWDSGGKVAIKSMAVGIEEASVTGLVSPPANAHLYSTMGDIGGFRHDDLTKSPAQMYTIPYAGTNSALDYAELSPSFMVRVGYGNPSATPVLTSSAYSYDGGATWFAGNKDISGISTSGGSVAAAADASRVLWAPYNAQISYSTDNGNTWTASAGIPQNAVVASDRVNPKKFYGYGQGQFWISTDGGATFTSTGVTGLPLAGNHVVVKAMPGHEGDIWIAGGSTGNAYGIWHSTNNGTTFTKLSSVTTADQIGFGMAAPGQTYMALFASATVGGVQGIYRSDDSGNTWILINDSQHQYAVITCITGDPRIYGRVYAGTNGLGIVYGDTAGAPPTITPGTTPTLPPTATPGKTPTVTPPPTATPGKTPTVPPPTPTPGSTPTVTSGGYKVSYVVQSQWSVGFTANIVITNNSSTAINGWTLKFSFANGQQVTQGWNGNFSQQTNQVTVQSESYNGSLAANGGSTSLGFNGSWTGSNTNPTAFTLNGVTTATS